MKKINLIFCKYIEAFTLHKHLKMGKPSSSPSGKKGLLKRVEKNARKAFISKLLEMLSKGQMKPENFFLEFAALNNTDKIKYFKTKVLDQNLPEALKTFVLSPSFKTVAMMLTIIAANNSYLLCITISSGSPYQNPKFKVIANMIKNPAITLSKFMNISFVHSFINCI